MEDRRRNLTELKNGIDRRKHDDDYAERIIGGARIDRSRRAETDDKPSRNSSSDTRRKP